MTEQNLSRLDARLRRAYDGAAEGYEQHRYTSTEGEFYRRVEDAMLQDLVQPAPGMAILDMPCGTGRVSIPLAAAGATVTGVDISEEMLKEARANTPPDAKDRLILHAGSGRSLPFPDASFDVVTSFKFFHLVDNDQKRVFLDELLRVTKPGGRLYVEFNSPFYGVWLALWRYAMKGNFRRMRTKCLFPDQVGPLLNGLGTRRLFGVKLPLSGAAAKRLGFPFVLAVNRLVSRIPLVKFFCYVLIVELRKADTSAR